MHSAVAMATTTPGSAVAIIAVTALQGSVMNGGHHGTYHVEHGHDQDEGGGCHGEDESYPRVVGDDPGGARKPGQRARGCFSPLLRQQEREREREREVKTSLLTLASIFFASQLFQLQTARDGHIKKRS